MGRNPEYSFHLLEEKSSNTASNLLVKYDMTAKDMALIGKSGGKSGEKSSHLCLL